MARRTVENINGFVMARQPAKPSSLKKSTTLLSRPKSVTFNESGEKKSTTPESKTVNPSTMTKKKEKQSSQPMVKKETPKRNVNAKINTINSKIKSAVTKISQNKTKNESNEEKSINMLETRTVDVSSNMSGDREEYEDDFEDYESDFESDDSVESSPESPTTKPVMAVNQSKSDDGAVGGKFALPVCVEEKLEPFLDEKYEVDSLERTVEMGLENFKTAGKRKREQEAMNKIKTRGNVLMEMIKLDRVSYTFLDLPPIPYEQYIQMYGRSNTTQIQTQTHDDNADKEVQTSEIELTEKWTQRPIVLTNEMDCSSLEYQRAKLGVGGDNTGDGRRRRTRIGPALDADRVCAVGRTMLSVLEHQSADGAKNRLVANDADFSGGHLSPAVSTVAFLANRPVISVEFVHITPSATESLVTTHEVKDSNFQFVICIWSISIMKNPEFVLKCPNRVTSLCTILKSINGYILAAQTDGSICVWDLRESRLHHQLIDGLPCPLRSPSFNTALSVDQGHRSKIVGMSTVTYRNANVTDEELPDEVCSLDEDFLSVLWTVMDSWTDAAEILEHNSAGTAPWSTVRLVKLQAFETNKSVPKCVSDGVMATCMCLNDNQDAFIGTNSGLVFRFNLGEHKVWPQYYVHKDKTYFSVSWLDICPFDSNYFLAACSSGEVMVFCASRREALRRLFATSDSQKASAPLLKAQWCSGFPGIVTGLDSLFSVHLWDLYDDVSTPIISVPFNGKKVTSMSLTSTRKSHNTHLGLSFIDGTVEIHLLKLDNRNTAKAAEEDSDDDQCNLFAQFLANMQEESDCIPAMTLNQHKTYCNVPQKNFYL